MNDVLFSKDGKGLIFYLAKKAGTSYEIPTGVTSIGNYAFLDCYNLTSITIPNSVTSIGNYAFRGCSSLANVIIPNGVKTIGNEAFYNCSSLASITIPNSVTSIGYSAFRDCNNITSITIPNSVTSIGSSAFGDCTHLETIVFEGTEEQWSAITKGSDWDYNAGKNTPAGKYVFTIKSSEGLKYTLNADGNSYSVAGIGACKDAEVIIPSTYV